MGQCCPEPTSTRCVLSQGSPSLRHTIFKTCFLYSPIFHLVIRCAAVPSQCGGEGAHLVDLQVVGRVTEVEGGELNRGGPSAVVGLTVHVKSAADTNIIGGAGVQVGKAEDVASAPIPRRADRLHVFVEQLHVGGRLSVTRRPCQRHLVGCSDVNHKVGGRHEGVWLVGEGDLGKELGTPRVIASKHIHRRPVLCCRALPISMIVGSWVVIIAVVLLNAYQQIASPIVERRISCNCHLAFVINIQRAMIEDMEILIVPIAIELVLRILCVIVIAFGHFHHAHFEPDVASPGGSIPPIVVVERNLLDGAVLHISEHFGRNNELGP